MIPMTRETLKRRISRAVRMLKASRLIGDSAETRWINQTVRRRQMTLVLAEALDLYWPNAGRPSVRKGE
jgi:hypothetical protein